MAKASKKASKKEVCKICGTCPTCGHRPSPVQFVPYPVYVWPVYYPSIPYTTPFINTIPLTGGSDFVSGTITNKIDNITLTANYLMN